MKKYIITFLLIIIISLPNVIYFSMSHMTMGDMVVTCPFSQLVNADCITQNNPLLMFEHHISFIQQFGNAIFLLSPLLLLLYVALAVLILYSKKSLSLLVYHVLSRVHRLRALIAYTHIHNIFLRWCSRVCRIFYSDHMIWTHA